MVIRRFLAVVGAIAALAIGPPAFAEPLPYGLDVSAQSETSPDVFAVSADTTAVAPSDVRYDGPAAIGNRPGFLHTSFVVVAGNAGPALFAPIDPGRSIV